MTNNAEHGLVLWLKTVNIALMLSLSGCGGGGGSGSDSGSQPQPNLAPKAVQLVEVSSNAVGQLTASWMPATDDSTASSNIRYQLHTSTQEGFAPAADTLRLESAGQLAGTVTSGLTAGQRNFVRLVALDEQGLTTASAPLSVYVADTDAALVPGVTAAVLQAGQTFEVAPNSIRLAAGVSAPAPGAIVVSAAGNGFLRRVTGVTTSGDQTTILTAPAALSEVVTQGQFSSTVRMSAIEPVTSIVQAPIAAGLRVEPTSDVTRRLTWAPSGLTYTAGVAGSNHGRERASAALRRDRLAAARFLPGALQSVYGAYGKVTAPAWVGSENSANGKVMISVATTSDEEPGWFGNGAVSVCDIAVADVTSEDPEVREIQLTANFLGVLEPTLRETSTGRVKAAQRELTIAPIANLAVSKYPYKITLRARLQDVKDNCQPATNPLRSAWRDEIETVITVFVTADSLPQGEQSTVDLNGSANAGFRVTSSVSTSFDPTVSFDVRLGERYAKVLIEASPMMEQTLTISADAAGSIDASAPVIQPRKFLKLFVTPGGIPVVVSGEFSLRLQVQGDVNGRLSATEKLTIGFDRMAYGIECNGPGNCQPIEERRPVVDLKLGGDGQATAALRVSLVPSLTVSLYELATGKVTLEPYAKADAGIEGKVEFEAGVDPAIQLPGLAFDADYRLTAARLAAGVNAYLFADLTPFDSAWDVWPSGATAANLSSHFAVRLAETTIADLPALTATVDMNSVNAADIRAIRIAASATNAPNPWKALFPSMPDSLIAWQRWTTPKIRAPLGVPAESYGFLNPDGAAEGEFWAFFTVPGTYLVRVGGFNVWGPWARQYTEVSVTVTDANGNGILDHVEGRGTGTAIAISSVACTSPVVGTVMTCTVVGSNLPADIGFLASNCAPSPMQAVPGGTTSLRSFTCTPQSAGVSVEVSYAVPGFTGPLLAVPTLPAADISLPIADTFSWPVDPTVGSRGHQGSCLDQALGCYWLSDAAEVSDQVWRDAQPFQQEANTTVRADRAPRWHLGADYNVGTGSADLGKTVFAAADGEVAALYENACGWGNVLVLRHLTPAGTVLTVYGHIDWLPAGKPDATANVRVRRGEPIAQIGSGSWTASQSCATAGSYTGVEHLHFEVRLSNDTNVGSGYTATQLGAGALGPEGQTDPNAFIRNRLAATVTGGRLNDTGVTSNECYAPGSNTLVSCLSAAAIQLNDKQDGMIGRDVTSNDDSDGKSGFSFRAVPKPTGGFYERTECVQDAVTGLMWEGKTSDSGPRDGSRTFTNAQTGQADDAEAYVSSINAAALCGFRDWRLPTAAELHSLVLVRSILPLIDVDWFPNTSSHIDGYWSSDRPKVLDLNPNRGFAVNFGNGGISEQSRTETRSHVRLTRRLD